MASIPKYPRTLHVGDSGGCSSRHQVDFDALKGRHLVVEEKVDGSHAGLFFDDDASLRVFSRSTILSEHTAHPSFRRLLHEADQCMDALWEVLGTRYVLYGEWAYAMHAIFYDALPAYFIEDDVYDRERAKFLDSSSRGSLLSGLPEDFSHSAPVLHAGQMENLGALKALVGPSRYRSALWQEKLLEVKRDQETDGIDTSGYAEGLYIKVEEDGRIQGRYKWIRPGFRECLIFCVTG